MKKLLLNKAMFLLAVIVSTVLYPSCGNNETGDRDDLYLVTTYRVASHYFKPKKLTVGCNSENNIHGNWFTNAEEQECADLYYFIEESKIKKYVDLHQYGKEVFIDRDDIASPYKEYSEYYGDTILKVQHSESENYKPNGIFYVNFCVLPVTGVDVTCNKDFDKEHPAGTLLNDIMEWINYENYYDCLRKKDKNGKLLYNGEKQFKIFSDEDYFIQSTPLDKIPNKPLMMTRPQFFLGFNHEPTEHGKYEFTVKFHFGPDPLSGETVDIDPAKVSIEF